jgi:hypothetical protein
LQDNMHSVNAFKFNNSIKVIYNIFILFFLIILDYKA